MSIPAETLYAALATLATDIAWTAPDGSTAFAYTSRRVRAFEDIPAFPALCQSENDEQVTQVTGLPSITTLSASWLIYHKAGANKDDDNNVPAMTTNAILDAVKAKFVVPTPDGMQELAIWTGVGNDERAHKVWIDGTIKKFQGDLDGQTLLVVPIKILIP